MLKRRGQGSSASRRRARGVYGPQSRAGGPRTRGRRVVPVRWSLRARAGRHDGRGASRRLTGSRVAAAPRPPTRPAPQCRAHARPHARARAGLLAEHGTPVLPRRGHAPAHARARNREPAPALCGGAHTSRTRPATARSMMSMKNNLSIVSPRQLRARTFSV